MGSKRTGYVEESEYKIKKKLKKAKRHGKQNGGYGIFPFIALAALAADPKKCTHCVE